GIGMVRSVTAVEAGDRTRVVVNLADAATHDIKVAGNQVVVRINAGTAQTTAATSESVVTKQVNAAMISSNGGKGIENVDFRRGDDGEGRILITLSDPSTVADLREEGGKVVLDFLDATLPERLMRKFDVSDFATPVKMFEVTSEGDNVHVEITSGGDYEHLAYQANNLFAIEFRPLTSAEKEKLQKERLVYTGERLSLNFQQIEVRAVLQLLADFTNLNLVTSDSVTGSITLRLQNVPWDQALEIILKAKGLSMRKNDNVVMVAPTEEIAAREKLELESLQQIEELAPLRSEYVQINYAKAADIAALLKSEGNQLLTPSRGNVTVDERTNTLLVRDTQSKLEDINRLVKRLDIPVRQVLIESRVVIANDDFAKDIGVRFGFNQSYSEKVGGNEILLAGGKTGHITGTGGLDTGTFMGVGAGISTGDDADATENLLVNMPSILGGDRGGAVNLLVGKIGSFLLQLELSAMQQEGRGEIVSSPRVITSDRNTAIIKAGKEIPYREASSSGAATVSFKEAVLKLEVTPQITPDDHVIMDLLINKDEPDFTRAVGGVPPLDTKEIETSVLVDNGETVVLGGVFERTRVSSTERIPFFGDLPYVGFMFKQNADKDNNTELLIFVTPKILKETIGMR
ncbi:MAG: type IV pilus secretin PilQ family protein, partial [Gammaproteobacteria bacterium]|nr:type IV pilus secretin PilQ family protein [Gammaproteobacteria bacterium]